MVVGAVNAGMGALGGKGKLAKKGLNEVVTDPKVKAIAADLAKRLGKNRVSVVTPSGRVQYDLAGAEHYEKTLKKAVETPHVKFQELNRGPNGKTNLSPGTVRPATMEDIRTVRNILERRGW